MSLRHITPLSREVVAAGVQAAIDDLNGHLSAQEMVVKILALIDENDSVSRPLLAGYASVLAFRAGDCPVTDVQALLEPATIPMTQSAAPAVRKRLGLDAPSHNTVQDTAQQTPARAGGRGLGAA